MIPVTLSKLEIGRQVELKVDHVSAVTLLLHLYSLRIPVGQSLLIACDIYITLQILTFQFKVNGICFLTRVLLKQRRGELQIFP